jgi:hydroxymethylbilane synthase
VLVSRDGHVLSTLPPIATVGTSSERRRLQLLRAKPALQVLPLRGNIDTRLRKVADGEFDAVVLAFAGLRRLYVPREQGGAGPLGLPLRAAPLEPGECLPAPAQGALAVECRPGDAAVLAACAAIDDPAARAAVAAERAFLEAVGGGCLAPVGALASGIGAGGADAAGLELAGMVADPVRRRVMRLSARGTVADPVELGRRLADDIRAAGGDELIAAVAGLRGAQPPDAGE